MVERPKPTAPAWRAFPANHVSCLTSVDRLVVPTVRPSRERTPAHNDYSSSG
jgi:hypothetical protein